MDNIVEKLTEIEDAATAIVAHTEIEKKEYEEEINRKKDLFDAELARDTEFQIEEIKKEFNQTVEAALESLGEKSELAIQGFENHYLHFHKQLARDIFKKIIEV